MFKVVRHERRWLQGKNRIHRLESRGSSRLDEKHLHVATARRSSHADECTAMPRLHILIPGFRSAMWKVVRPWKGSRLLISLRIPSGQVSMVGFIKVV
jgi:hypothetical protein